MYTTPKSGFVEFDLLQGPNYQDIIKSVVCFSDVRYTAEALELTGDTAPITWHPDYRWDDLNILPEVYQEPDGPNLEKVMMWIRAFGFTKDAPVYMHVWCSRLPKLEYHFTPYGNGPERKLSRKQAEALCRGHPGFLAYFHDLDIGHRQKFNVVDGLITKLK